jgi:hypothetical protein
LETRILKKWRKNLGLSIFIFIVASIICALFISLYMENHNVLYLAIFLSLIVLFTIIYATSLNTWNEYLYMDDWKIWANRKGRIIEWRFEEMSSCKIIAWPFWSKRFYYGCEVICKSQPTKLVFESNIRVEKLLLEITKGKDSWNLFHKAFK